MKVYKNITQRKQLEENERLAALKQIEHGRMESVPEPPEFGEEEEAGEETQTKAKAAKPKKKG